MTSWIERARSAANEAFERWVPRQCTHAWLAQVSGAARFCWDVPALQQGFVDPLYRVCAARPERWRPILAATLLRASGLEPMDYSSLLAALELWYLAGAMLTHVRNGSTVAEAAPDRLDIPLPVLATAAFTASTYATDLVASHTPFFDAERRTGLLHELMRSFVRAGIGGAVDNHQVAQPRTRPQGEDAYLSHVRVCTGEIVFRMPLECAIAVVGSIEASEASLLRGAVTQMGIGYHLATEVLMAGQPGPSSGLDLPLEPPLRWAFDDALGSGARARALVLADEALQAARAAVNDAAAPWRAALREFMAAVCDQRLTQARRALHA